MTGKLEIWELHKDVEGYWGRGTEWTGNTVRYFFPDLKGFSKVGFTLASISCPCCQNELILAVRVLLRERL